MYGWLYTGIAAAVLTVVALLIKLRRKIAGRTRRVCRFFKRGPRQ